MGSSETRVRPYAAFALSMCLATSGVAGVRLSNTIDRFASISDKGRHLVVTGPIACPANDRVRIRVTVSQRETGAVAEGTSHVVCNGGTQQWVADLSTRGRQAFVPGPATAVALGETTNPVDSPDAHQWLVAIELRH